MYSDALSLFKAILEDSFKSSGIDRDSEKSRLKIDINQIDERIDKAAFNNLDCVWDEATYLKTKEKLEVSKNKMVVKLNLLNTLAPQFSSYVTNSTNLLQNLGDFYTD